MITKDAKIEQQNIPIAITTIRIVSAISGLLSLLLILLTLFVKANLINTLFQITATTCLCSYLFFMYYAYMQLSPKEASLKARLYYLNDTLDEIFLKSVPATMGAASLLNLFCQWNIMNTFIYGLMIPLVVWLLFGLYVLLKRKWPLQFAWKPNNQCD